jgi:predicted lipoprotein with Yx(FWY)xxD motif
MCKALQSAAEFHAKGNAQQMNNRLISRKGSLALKLGLPLAAAGVFAAACSSSGAATGSAPSTSSGTSAPGGSSSASTIDVRTSNGTTYLTDSSGRSLYLWVPDTTTMSMCSGACAVAWPPLTTTGAPTAGIGVTASDLGTINRSDGTNQITYAGHPLYYYVGDKAAGQTNGEGSNGFGAPWYLVAPSGEQITSLSAASAPSPAPSSSSASNAGGGSSSSSSSDGGGNSSSDDGGMSAGDQSQAPVGGSNGS